MIAILQTIFALALLLCLPVYALYFMALYSYGRLLEQSHPDVYRRIAAPSDTGLTRSYAALQALHKDRALLASLTQPIQSEFRFTYRLLLIGMCSFMVMLFTGLAGAVIAGKA